MMAKTIYIDCPFCEGMMEIDTASGKVVEKWAPGEKSGAGKDKLSSALEKLEEDKKKRRNLFSAKQEELEGNKKKLASSFEEEVKRVKKKGGPERPANPFDWD